MTDQKANVPAAVAPANSMGILMDPAKFDHVQRVAGMMANSALFPEHLRKGGERIAIANAVLVFDMAFRMNESPLTVARNIYFVGGKPGWLTTYMIARANQSGVFSDQIEWEVEGEKDDLAVTAFATLARSGRRAAVTVDMTMAKAEGWTSNKKYQSMPVQMLRWRSATALIRLYAPEVMIGMQTQDELAAGQDMVDVTPRTEQATKPSTRAKAKPAPVVEDADTVAPEDSGPDVMEDEQEPTEEDDAPAPAADATESGPEREQWERRKDQILADLLDSQSPSGVREFYKTHLKKMEAEAPDLHAEIMAQMKEYENG